MDGATVTCVSSTDRLDERPENTLVRSPCLRLLEAKRAGTLKDFTDFTREAGIRTITVLEQADLELAGVLFQTNFCPCNGGRLPGPSCYWSR